jgi:hypothetical protein
MLSARLANPPPPTMQRVFAQPPSRPKSREIQLPWDIKCLVQEEFVSQGKRAHVFLKETKGIQEKAMVKVYLSPIRDDTWERIAEGRFGFPVEIDPGVSQVGGTEMIECHAIYIGRPSSPKSVLRVPPKIPKSFQVGIEVALGYQVASLRVPNIAMKITVEYMLSARWRISVQFKSEKPRL